MLRNALTAIVLICALSLAPSAQARQACGERNTIINGLGTEYGETNFGAGLQSETQMIEIWASRSTGSFTILLSTPDGKSCILSSGDNWTPNEQRPLQVGKPS